MPLRDRLVGLRLALAPRRTTATFHCRHPGGRTAPAFTPSGRESLQGEDRFVELVPLRP